MNQWSFEKMTRFDWLAVGPVPMASFRFYLFGYCEKVVWPKVPTH